MENDIEPDASIISQGFEQDPEFDRAIGQLDYCLSCLMVFAKRVEQGALSLPNRQTLKHHAEDMEAAAKAIYKRLGIAQEGTPQPKPKTDFVDKKSLMTDMQKETILRIVSLGTNLSFLEWERKFCVLGQHLLNGRMNVEEHTPHIQCDACRLTFNVINVRFEKGN